MPTFSFSTPTGTTDASIDKQTKETAAPSKKKINRKKTPEPTTAPEPDNHEPAAPTFPDMVILKQTEHNYIVKHNHYPILNSAHNIEHSDSIQDLVSPNQIYKGQINKKRGRKPKAGFILNSSSSIYDSSEVPNIILHLKCHLSDLKTNESITKYGYTPSIEEVESYNITSNYLQSSDISQTLNSKENDDNDDNEVNEYNNIHNDNNNNNEYTTDISCQVDDKNGLSSNRNTLLPNIENVKNQTTNEPFSNGNGNVKKIEPNSSAIQIVNQKNHKEIMKKIQRLKYSFHNGENIPTKINHKSACFWDTCEFDGPIYYIPIMVVNGVFQVNGCYCSPECAVAALLKEPLDTSSKFERLHLLHLLYGTPGGKGFKPAPNPNYLLDKYYGNLTIQEYRALLKGSQMIHIVNKPLTHILPELYEDNNDFLVNSKVIPTNNSMKLKKRYKTMVIQGSGGGCD